MIDLDAARAARREAAGEGPEVVFKGERFTLAPEIPFRVAENVSNMARAAAEGDQSSSAAAVIEVLRSLFGEQWDRFEALNPSVADIQILLEEAMKSYGFASAEEGLGEPPASASSS